MHDNCMIFEINLKKNYLLKNLVKFQQLKNINIFAHYKKAQKFMKRYYIYTLLLFLIQLTAVAQNFSIKKLTVEQGLSNNFVVSIVQDKTGSMWIATEEGLNRFDGNEFEQFYKKDDNSVDNWLSGNELNCILDDPTDSILWIATQRAGLNAYNYHTNQFKVYKPQENGEGIISEAVTKIVPAKDGNIWIATYWNGVDYYDKKNDKFTHYNHNTVKNWILDNIWTVTESNDDVIYIGYIHQGFASYNLKTGEFKNYVHNPNDNTSIQDNEILSIYIDDYNNIWVGTRSGLALFDPTSGKFQRFNFITAISDRSIFDIKMAEPNKLWVALELGGIVILDIPQGQFNSPQDIKFSTITEGYGDSGLSGNSVRCITNDKYGNIWTGIWSGGVNFINPAGNIFGRYSYTPAITINDNSQFTNSLTCKSILSIVTDQDDNIWLGTDGGGLNVYNKCQRIAVYNMGNTPNITSDCIQTSYCDRNGNLWFGTFFNGIFVYDISTEKFETFLPNDLKKIDVRSFCEYDAQNILVATSTGVYKININTKKVEAHYDLPQNLVRTILRDTYGNIWAGTFGGGLFILDQDLKVIKSFNTGEKFPSNTINHLLEDSQNRILVATGEGMVCFDNHQSFDYKVFGRNEGLANAHIRAINEDKFHNIWISTNNGISCYLESEKRIVNYDSRDKIPAGGFSSGATSKNKNGYINFGSANGLCRFDCARVLSNEVPPRAIIGRMKVFLPVTVENPGNQKIISKYDSSGVILDASENNFSVSFLTDNYAFSDIIEYSCKIEGQESNYYTVSDPKNVTFRNIQPGTYTICVKTRFRNQKWSDDVTKLKIKILPPWYSTTLAKVIYILLFISFIVMSFLAYRRRVKITAQLESEKQNREKQDALNEERMRFFTNIAHEIRTPLSLIVGPLEDLCNDKSFSEAVSKKLNVINQSSHQLLKLTNYLMDFRKTETHNKRLCVSRGLLNQVVEDTVKKFQELNRNKNVEIKCDIEETNFEIYFDRQSIITILDNLITNAMKYTEQGIIKISLRKSGYYAEIGIEDTGYGISESALPHIFERYYQEQGPHQASGTGIGLSLVKNLIDLHKGKITVQSEQNKGTKFTVFLSLDEKYPDALHADNAVENEEPKSEENIKNEITTASQDNNEENKRPILLIVEDNIDIQDYIKNSLADKYDVLTATNGKDGIETALKELPDIVVSDIMMPVKNGIELCKTLKNDIRTSHIPIILLTAKDTMKDKTEGYEAGADSYITKPFSATLLTSRIVNLLDKQKQLAKFFKNSNPKDKDNAKKHETFLQSLNQLDLEFIENINKIIEQNLEDPEFNVSTLSQILCLSNSTLYRKIKALTGISPNEYLRKIKMKKAEAYILEGKYSISQIAFKVGMNSELYFRQYFKDEFGMLPSEYIKSLKQE